MEKASTLLLSISLLFSPLSSPTLFSSLLSYSLLTTSPTLFSPPLLLSSHHLFYSLLTTSSALFLSSSLSLSPIFSILSPSYPPFLSPSFPPFLSLTHFSFSPTLFSPLTLSQDGVSSSAHSPF